MVEQALVETVSVQDVLILDGDIDDTTGDLTLGYLYAQHLFVRERQFRQDDDVTISLLEAVGSVQGICRSQFNRL